ncbi:hypothetical protein ACWDR1_20715 [Streptosporangium sandarakinum]|uniref:hypothetical protein n=1 Tax=Streptosporangium sandarakinum TaxID=1260955 RepID=UPI0033B7A84F
MNVAVQVADIMVMTLPFVCGREGTVSLGAKPYALDTPLSEVVRDVQVVTPAAASPMTRVCA